MSIIFGLRTPHDRRTISEELERLGQHTIRYGSTRSLNVVRDGLGMAIQPYFTGEDDRKDFSRCQPSQDDRGDIALFDGRLDNRAQLCDELDLAEIGSSDGEIVLAAFARWHYSLCSRLIGEWALALWSESNRCIYLARDHAGSRSLYYLVADDALYWSTYVETLVVARESLQVEDEYLARYIAWLPTLELTPYKGIFTVPPAHVIGLGSKRPIRHMHWNPTRVPKVTCSTERDYDERFLALFEEAVARRLGNTSTTLAHLSGGMDSTAIVCMADHIATSGRLSIKDSVDTLSFFDDSEPNWNERPYFQAVEAYRGKQGIHFDTSAFQESFLPWDSSKCDYLFPGPHRSTFDKEVKLEAMLSGHDYRVVLSGIGGDEVLGGVPSCLPELAQHLFTGDLSELMQRSFDWSLYLKKPLVNTVLETASYCFHAYVPAPLDMDIDWLAPRVQKVLKNHRRDSSYGTSRIGVSPQAIEAARSWFGLQETLPSLYPGILKRREYRYPYLDRDLAEFCLGVPKEQHVQPGRKRALMRRALRGLVPDVVLERRRKAYVARSPWMRLRGQHDSIESLLKGSLLAYFGYVDSSRFRAGAEAIMNGATPPSAHFVIRALEVELWLRVKYFGSREEEQPTDHESFPVPAIQNRPKSLHGRSP